MFLYDIVFVMGNRHLRCLVKEFLFVLEKHNAYLKILKCISKIYKKKIGYFFFNWINGKRYISFTLWLFKYLTFRKTTMDLKMSFFIRLYAFKLNIN